MPAYKLCYLGHASMCLLASCEAYQAAPCVASVPGSWQCTTHVEAVAQAFGTNAPKRYFGAWELAMHHAREAVAQAFEANAPKRR